MLVCKSFVIANGYAVAVAHPGILHLIFKLLHIITPVSSKGVWQKCTYRTHILTHSWNRGRPDESFDITDLQNLKRFLRANLTKRVRYPVNKLCSFILFLKSFRHQFCSIIEYDFGKICPCLFPLDYHNNRTYCNRSLCLWSCRSLTTGCRLSLLVAVYLWLLKTLTLNFWQFYHIKIIRSQIYSPDKAFPGKIKPLSFLTRLPQQSYSNRSLISVCISVPNNGLSPQLVGSCLWLPKWLSAQWTRRDARLVITWRFAQVNPRFSSDYGSWLCGLLSAV